MNTKNNALHSETEAHITEALFYFTAQGMTPTVRTICEKASINRATFYRHYQDIPELMEKTQNRILTELLESFKEAASSSDYISRDMLGLLVRHIDRSRAFFKMYLSMSDITETGMEQVWESYFRPLFQSYGVTNESHMKYYHCFYMAGFIAVLRRWLQSGTETPEELADILWHYTDRVIRRDTGTPAW